MIGYHHAVTAPISIFYFAQQKSMQAPFALIPYTSRLQPTPNICLSLRQPQRRQGHAAPAGFNRQRLFLSGATPVKQGLEAKNAKQRSSHVPSAPGNGKCCCLQKSKNAAQAPWGRPFIRARQGLRPGAALRAAWACPVGAYSQADGYNPSAKPRPSRAAPPT